MLYRVWIGAKIHILSLANRYLTSSFLVVNILCNNLNENCLNLLSLVDLYIKENLVCHSVKASANLIYQVLILVGSTVELLLSIL